MDWAAILAAVQRASAAYLEDPSAARDTFVALGYKFVGQYQTESCQAVLSENDDATFNLSISGTRFSDGKLLDLFHDLDIEEVAPPGEPTGALVTRGAWDDLPALWSWVFANVPAAAHLTVEGHSLGGWRTRYTPSFLDASRIVALYSFESPKGANLAYWTAHLDVLREKLTSVIHGRDIFVSYPFFSNEIVHPPLVDIWLNGGGYSLITPDQFPGGLYEKDHDIDTVVNLIADLAAQATSQTPSPASTSGSQDQSTGS